MNNVTVVIVTGSRTLPRPPRDATETRWRAQIPPVCAWKGGRWSSPVSESAWTVVKPCTGVGGCKTHTHSVGRRGEVEGMGLVSGVLTLRRLKQRACVHGAAGSLR